MTSLPALQLLSLVEAMSPEADAPALAGETSAKQPFGSAAICDNVSEHIQSLRLPIPLPLGPLSAHLWERVWALAADRLRLIRG